MMNAEQFVKELQPVLGTRLKSVVLYGSEVSGDTSRRFSDVNLLIVTDVLDLSVLKSVAPLVRRWCRRGYSTPLFFTEEHMKDAADVFPIELSDIHASHRILHGPDPFLSFDPASHDLRRQLEFELRSKMIQLRQKYLEMSGRRRPLQELLARAVSSLTVLFRATLRLCGENPAATKRDVVQQVAKHVSVDTDAFNAVLDFREGRSQSLRDPEALLSSLIVSVERVIRFVDHPPSQETPASSRGGMRQ